MSDITRSRMIELLCELDTPDAVEHAVDRALDHLGWRDKASFSGAEVIELGTIMARQAVEVLANSPSPAARRDAAELAPMVSLLETKLVPQLGAEA